MPRRSNARVSAFTASGSSIGMMLSSISTIVTSVPRWLKIEANSQPITPPPRTTSRLGTSSTSSSPVESTQRGWSMPSIAGRSECEPVAITAFRNETSSAPSTAKALGPSKRPSPCTTVTPFALSSVPTPFTEVVTISDLLAWTRGQPPPAIGAGRAEEVAHPLPVDAAGGLLDRRGKGCGEALERGGVRVAHVQPDRGGRPDVPEAVARVHRDLAPAERDRELLGARSPAPAVDHHA